MSDITLTIEEIGTTGKLCIKEDNAISLMCRERGRLDWDDNFNTIPEIQNLQKDDVVFDVGAYIGDTTDVFVKRGCVVYAFEPSEIAFECLKKNCPTAYCFNTAIGSGQNYSTQIMGANIGGIPIKVDPNSNLKAVSIDKFVESYGITRLDFLKIDVEGFEPFVLAGAQRSIIRFKPTLMVEVNPHALGFFQNDAKTLQRQIESLGYFNSREVFRYYEQNWDLLCKMK